MREVDGIYSSRHFLLDRQILKYMILGVSITPEIVMTKVHVTDREGETRSIDATLGSSLMQVITDNGISEMLALCGGMCSCATCHVYIDSDHGDLLPSIHDDEDGLLSVSDHRKDNSRLACQVRMTAELENLRVTIAPAD